MTRVIPTEPLSECNESKGEWRDLLFQLLAPDINLKVS